MGGKDRKTDRQGRDSMQVIIWKRDTDFLSFLLSFFLLQEKEKEKEKEKTLQPTPQIHMHSLNLTISFQPRLSQLPPNPTLFDASKRHARITVLTTINPHHSRFDFCRHTMGAFEIRREDGCSESVAAVVGALEGGGFVLEGGEGYDWAEDFFAVWKRGGFWRLVFFFFFLFGLYGGEKEDREGKK